MVLSMISSQTFANVWEYGDRLRCGGDEYAREREAGFGLEV